MENTLPPLRIRLNSSVALKRDSSRLEAVDISEMQFFCLAGYEERSRLKPLIWKVWAPQKCKFFAWLITKNRVWTSERLVTRGWPRNNVSPLCRREYKTTRHLLAACRYTKRVWSLIATWIAWPQLNPNCWQTTSSAGDRGRMILYLG